MLPPKASAYVKSYDGQKNYFLIEEDGLSEKYKNIWNKVSTDTIKEFQSESVYDKEFLKTKIKSHCDEVINFCDKKFLW